MAFDEKHSWENDTTLSIKYRLLNFIVEIQYSPSKYHLTVLASIEF